MNDRPARAPLRRVPHDCERPSVRLEARAFADRPRRWPRRAERRPTLRSAACLALGGAQRLRQAALRKVHLRRTRRPREAVGLPGPVANARIVRRQGIDQRRFRHREPLASIALVADRFTPVPLVTVVKHHRVRVGDDRHAPLVGDPHATPRKDEDVRADRTGIREPRVVGTDSKRRDIDQGTRK